MRESRFGKARKKYHAKLLQSVLTVNNQGMLSNADKDSRLSVRITQGIAEILKFETGIHLTDQTSGGEFGVISTEFLQDTFLQLGHIRLGTWEIKRIGNRNRKAIDFEQDAHLLTPDNATAWENDYTITPDIIIYRRLLSDLEIKQADTLVDDQVSHRTSLRSINEGKPLLHASISSKWTIRSDRSQNTRSEALNLIWNRKGHLPHIVAVTVEPLPSRLASIALGTRDIDCVYHFALNELITAVEAAQAEDSLEMLSIMIQGKRLKDISDLPLDLAT